MPLSYYRFVNRPTSVRSHRHLAQCPYASGNWKRTAPPPILPSITKPLERIGTLPHRRYRKPGGTRYRRYRGGTDQYNSGFHSYHRSVGSRIRILLLSRSVPALGSVGILPIFLLGSRFYMKRMRRYTREIRQSDSRIQSVIQESLQHRTVIKTLEQSDQHIGKLDDLQDALRSQIFGRTRFSLSARMLVAFAFSGGYLTAFLWGAIRLSTGSITFGTMTAFLQLVGKVQRPASIFHACCLPLSMPSPP